MALTAEDLEARIFALQKSRDAGVLRVRHGNDQVDYASIADMNKVLANLQAQLDALNGVSRPRLNYLRQDSKGFGTCESPFQDWTENG